MQVEVDLSSKLHRTGEPNALAFADGIQYSVRILGREKRKVEEELAKRRPEMERSRRYILLFATEVTETDRPKERPTDKGQYRGAQEAPG